MQVAQRGTSSTTSGDYTVDRYRPQWGNTDENATMAQVDVASGTTPYTSGFRKALRITNGNQTSGAGSSDYLFIRHKIEAQDMATSGWNYVSASSYITLSFWIKSSVAQTFNSRLETQDGTALNYPFQYTISSANTWTKITKTIQGNSNLSFNNDNGTGVEIHWDMFRGTDYSDNSVSNDVWAAYSGTARSKDQTSTFYTTNDATFEITGVQLEVGPTATTFEHRSYGEELARCQRYYHCVYRRGASSDSNVSIGALGSLYTGNSIYIDMTLPTQMRTTPTIETPSATNRYNCCPTNCIDFGNPTLIHGQKNAVTLNATLQSSNTAGRVGNVFAKTANWTEGEKLAFTAEL